MKFVGQLLERHLLRYPAMELADIYKLLHQAALGPGHAVDNAQTARERLDSEAAALGDGTAELLADPISPDGALARIHLRSYVAQGHSLADLSDAFVRTARDCAGSPEKLAKFCGCLGDLAEAGGIPFARVEVEHYMSALAKQGYPAVHHSAAFRTAYRPAYRVVALDYLKGIAA